MVNSVAEINKEIVKRCNQMGLVYDCGADGIFNSEIAIIAEAPGDRERTMKMPLVGGSGTELWNTLRQYGINRRSVYISNVMKRQLLAVANSTGKEKIGHGEVSMYSSILLWELSQLPNLKFVLVLGNYALQALTGLTGISLYRGSVLDVQLSNPSTGDKRDVKVIAALNPAAILREPKNQLMFRFDMKRFNDVVTGQFEEYNINAIINPTFDEAMAWIEKMRTGGLPVGLDIETSSGETICVGLGNDPHEGMCINFRDATANRFSVREELQLWIALQNLVADEKVRLVTQNGMYDFSWTWFHNRLVANGVWFDTMLAHHTLYPSMPHNLGFLTTQYTTHPFYKDEGKIWKESGDINAEWRYNVKDVCLMLACQQGMLKELQDQKLDKFFFDHVMPTQPELIKMTVGGVKVDVPRKKQIAEEMKDEIAKLKEQYYRQVAECTGDTEYRPNPNSPKQMAELFFKRLRLVGRGVATDKENRRRMREHPRTPVECRTLLQTVDKLATEQKFASTYAESEQDADGRMRCEYKQTGVMKAPGRLSSAGTGWGTGTNLQNQPDRAHEMFIADEGYELNYFDLAQAEARVVALRAVIPEWIEQFERARLEGGFDAHKALGATLFNIPYEDMPDSDRDPEGQYAPYSLRFIAKKCRHALNYRMMPDRLATELQIPYSRAEYLWHQYHRITPELQQWWDWQIKQVKEKQVIYNAYGRRWILLERMSDEAVESVVAFYPQSTIGDKVTRIIRQCHSDPDWPSNDARIALNIHDALIAINRIGFGDVVRTIMRKYAEEPLLIEGMDGQVRELIIPCDLKVSKPDDKGVHRWSTLEKIKE
ncbi:MAG TPA: DNA polymerase [Candidatus Saccharimonadales bacterium]|nr:DNA polymerase [Candidatus Saccharimonadales bacterium]